MIDYYLRKYEIVSVKPQLLIRKMTDPNYIQKDEMEQIYLDEKEGTVTVRSGGGTS